MSVKKIPTVIQFAGHDRLLFKLGEEVFVVDEYPDAVGGETGQERRV